MGDLAQHILGPELEEKPEMEDIIRHYCGVAVIHLKKPLDYFNQHYGPGFLIDRLVWMLVKQRNRGQDSAGILTCNPYQPQFLPQTFSQYSFRGESPAHVAKILQAKDLQQHMDSLMGIGHVRYGTFEVDSPHSVQPHIHEHERPNKEFGIAINGNFANNEAQQQSILDLNHRIKSKSDIVMMKHRLAHEIRTEQSHLLSLGWSEKQIETNFTLENVLARSSAYWKGAYVLVGLFGTGDLFVARGPEGIRPFVYWENDDFFVGASETVALTEPFSLDRFDRRNIKVLQPGAAVQIKPKQKPTFFSFAVPLLNSGPCNFGHVYFQRPNSEYRRLDDGKLVSNQTARILLGRSLAETVAPYVKDVDDLVVTYVPNTSRSAAKGLHDGLQKILGKEIEYIDTLEKDEQSRTFIQNKETRLASTLRAYDPIFDAIEDKNVVVVDDSIVKGNTMENSILSNYIRAGAKDIYVISSSPMIKYPCCYGIEMSNLREFAAFKAAIEVIKDEGFDATFGAAVGAIKEKGLEGKLHEIFDLAKQQQARIDANFSYIPEANLIDRIYSMVTDEEICDKMAEMLRPKGLEWNGKLKIIFNIVPSMKEAIGNGEKSCAACMDGKNAVADAYRVLNKALINFFEKQDKIAY